MESGVKPGVGKIGVARAGHNDWAARIDGFEIRPVPESFERMRFYLREIGQGPRSGRDLTQDEASDAMTAIFFEEVPMTQAAGFLLLQRYKGESPEELLGFTEAIRTAATTISPQVEGLLDVGSPYDGRKKSIVVSPASSIVAAAAGVPVVMHGEKDLGPKHGVPIGDVLEALGMDVDAQPDAVKAAIESQGIGYMHQERFLPRIRHIRRLREEVALRTVLSTVEKIYNLANASYSILGLAHLPYAEKMMATAAATGFKRILIIQGIEGNEDAPTSRPCRAFLWENESHTEIKIDASDYGLQPASKEEMGGGDAAYNAAIARRILAGDPGAYRDLVLLNAGIRSWLAERAPTIGEGIEVAREAIDSGAAARKLDEVTQAAAPS